MHKFHGDKKESMATDQADVFIELRIRGRCSVVLGAEKFISSKEM